MVKIFIGDCSECDKHSPNYITTADLRDMLSDYKSLKEVERVDGKPFGFAHLSLKEEANDVCSKFNKFELKKQKLAVMCSKSKPVKLYIGRLPQGTKEADLRTLFENYGAEVIECDVIQRPQGKFLIGFVHIETNASKKIVDKLLDQMNGLHYNGSVLNVQLSEKQSSETLHAPDQSMNNGGRTGNSGFRGGPGRGRGTPYFKEQRPSPYPIMNPIMQQSSSAYCTNDLLMHQRSVGGLSDSIALSQQQNFTRDFSTSKIQEMGAIGGWEYLGGIPRRELMFDEMGVKGSSPHESMIKSETNSSRCDQYKQRHRENALLNTRGESKLCSIEVKEKRPHDTWQQQISDFEGCVSTKSLQVMGESLTNMVKSSLHIDTYIKVQGTPFKTHAVILSARSPVLADRIMKSGDTIHIDDFSPNVVTTMLQFMYTGQLDADIEVMADVILMAEHYKVEGVSNAVQVALVKDMNVHNATNYLHFSVQNNLTRLREFAAKFIVQNPRKIMEDPQAKNVLKLYPDVMLELVETLSLQTN